MRVSSWPRSHRTCAESSSVTTQSGEVLSPRPLTGSLLVIDTMRDSREVSALSVAVTETATGTIWLFSTSRLGSTHTAVIVGAVTSTTLKVVVQVATLPSGSTAWIVTVCTPTPRAVPAAGDWVTVEAPLQLSTTVAEDAKSGTIAVPVAPASAVIPSGHVTEGRPRLLSIVRVVEQALELPAASVTVSVITCVPSATSVPAAGD